MKISSPMTSPDIEAIRLTLNEWIHEYQVLCHTRAHLITLMAYEKKTHAFVQSLAVGKYPFYDPERELKFFSSMKSGKFSSLPPAELLSFSLLMEAQANTYGDPYPSWSQGAHLEHHKKMLIPSALMLYTVMNPLMVKVFFPEKLPLLPLNKDFLLLLKKLS